MPEGQVGLTRSPRVQVIGVVLVFLTAVGGGLCGRTFHQPLAPIGVVIITLDTTRAERLSVYGFMDAAMPHFEHPRQFPANHVFP
jgi:hypothetical protein